MPYSSGTFSRVHDFTDDRDNGIRIQASRMDAEMDGIATGLSTALLKDGTQTATAKIPFAVGLSIIDNQTLLLGTNSDIAIQYDESTNDSLEIAANVEGAGLGIVLKADQGDDNADQHKLSIADGGTLTLASKISGSFVTYLTHTPNATVTSSTLAVAGNLTVGGNLTLGSGAELSEAELEQLDGITAGTVTASKAVVVDANKDIASFRNITLTGELDAGSLDVSGDVDIDGTLETDALSIASTAITATGAELNLNDTGAAVGTVVASKTVTVDANKDVSSFRNITLTGELDAGSLDVSGDADIDGTLEADAITIGGTAIGSIFSPIAGGTGIVTTGALDAGSITSNFGTINNGASAITTTGAVSVGAFTSNGIDDNASSTAITLDSSGNLLVGTTDNQLFDNTSGGGLCYRPSLSLDIAREATSSSNSMLTLNNTGVDARFIEFRKDATTVGSIGTFDAGYLYIASPRTTDAGIKIGTSRIVPSTTTGADRDGAIDLGYSSGRFKDLYLSGGVYLGGTGSANLLDDYEEGTWTPAISTTTGSITINSSFSGGSYTKIGDTVMAWAKIRPLSQSSPTGGLDITGLPFTAKSSSGTNAGGVGQGIVEGSYSSDPNIVLAQVGASSTSITLRRRNGATSTNDMATYLVDGNYYTFTVIYKI